MGHGQPPPFWLALIKGVPEFFAGVLIWARGCRDDDPEEDAWKR